MLLPTLCYGTESWIDQEKFKWKWNTVGNKQLRTVCDKTEREKFKDKQLQKECGLKQRVNNQCERSAMVDGGGGHIVRLKKKKEICFSTKAERPENIRHLL